MTTTPARHVNELTDLVDGARAAVTAHAGRPDTAALVAGQLRAHLPGGDIHRVRNTSETTAISLDVYGTDITRIGSAARRYHD